MASRPPRNLPVPAGPVREEPQAAPRRSPRAAATAFDAQLLGQPGQKRGLRGGPPVLEEARSAYLETEYSGPHDRRLRKGRLTKTEV